MFLKGSKAWTKLTSVVLSFAILFTTLMPVKWLPTALAAEASGTSVSQPEPVELPWYRNETTKVFGNPNGTLTAEVSLEPIHYKEGNLWLDINNTLEETSDGQSFSNKANKFKVTFPTKPKERDITRLFDYSIAGKNITFGVSNDQSDNTKLHAKPQDAVGKFKGNDAKFNNLYPGVSFNYVVDGSKVKENIIVDSYQGKNSFEFVIKGSGLTASKKSDGSIEFKDKASDKFLFNIPRPYMFDSNKQDSPEGVTSQAVTQDITPTQDGFVLTVIADEAFLTDHARVYPVTIDPWIDYFNAQDTYIASGYPSLNYYSQDRLYVGHDATIGATRSLVKWPTLPDIPDAEVLGSQIGFYQYHAYQQVAPVEMHRITSGWVHNLVNWSTPISVNPIPEDTIDNASFVNDWYNYFEATNLVKDWYANPQTNYGVMFKYADSQEYTNTRRSFHSYEWSNPDGTKVGKPKLIITFRSKEFLGLADYWKFTPDIFQGEGTGVVNVINGNFVYDIPVLDLKSRVNAFNLKMVYNSRSFYQDAWGYGWTFSEQRRLIFNSDRSIVEYLDEDGTRSHFAKLQTDTASSYTAPEGTYLELTAVGSEYTIKQPDETVLYFDQYGRNYKIVDEKGNTVKYVFDTSAPDSRKIVKIQERYGSESTGRDINLTYRVDGLLDTITDLKGTLTKFNYDIIGSVSRLSSVTYAYGTTDAKPINFTYYSGNRLYSVTDAKGNVGTIEYNTDNKVSKVTDPRSTPEIPMSAQITYPSATETVFTDAKGYKTYYKNDSDQNLPTINVTQMIGDYQGTQPATTTYEWNKNTLTKVIEPNKDTGAATGSTHTGTYDTKANLTQASSPENLGVNNTYDAKSNPTKEETNGTTYDNLYDSKSNLISSTNNHGLTDYNTYDQFGNVLSSTSPTRETHNRIQNSNFEIVQSGQPTLWSNRGIGQYSADTSTKLLGNYSGKIYLSATDGAGYFSQLVPVAADETDKDYTLSVFVKTSSVTGTGANLRVYFKDSAGNFIYNGGNIVKYESKAVSGTTDWTRLSYYFTAPAGTATVQVDLLFTGAGTVYFDGTELVYGRVLDNYYSNENASFEWGNLDNWTMSSLVSGDGKSSEMVKRGNYSVKINGTTASKYLGQYAEVKGNANDPLTISGWAYSTGPNHSGGYFALDVVLRYTDGSEEVFIREFDKSRANQWQILKSTIRAQKPFYQAKVYLLYYNQTGAVYFDNIKLEERSSLSQKTYDPSGNFVKTETDEFNNLTSNNNYDLNGDLVDSTDASGKVVSFVYTLLNKIKSVTLKGPTTVDDITVSYDYDPQGNLKTRTDPNGHITTFEYNPINKARTETDLLGKFISYDYDENGNLKSSTRGKGTNVVQSESYTYDRKNRVYEKFVGGVKQFTNTYNFADDKTDITLADGVTKYTYSYDGNHRLLTATEPGGSYSLTNEYGQTVGNSNGVRTKYTETVSGVNKTTSFGYDGLRRLISATGPTGGLTEFFYSERGAQSRIKNGSTEIFQDFDNAGRLTSQAVIGTSKLDLKNSYFSNSQVNTYTEGSTTHTFAYDFAKRLYSWNNGTSTVTYDYDKAGNLKNPHGLNLTFNEANEIIGFLYDDAGNLTQDNKYKYTWNQEGQLTSVKNLSDVVLASFTYHPDGLRKTKTVGSTTYNYHYDGTNLIRITNGSGATVWTFTWADGKPVSLTNSSGTTFYYVTNFRGDVVQIMDGNGTSVASYSYDPWGKVLSASENPAVAGQPLRYASYVYDTETQLYYLQARYYDPDIARFISRDPDGGDQDNPLSQNLYAYTNDDPVNHVDPDGQWAFLIGAIINVAIYHFTTPESERTASGYAFAAATGVIGGFATAAVGSSVAARVVYKTLVTSRGRLLAGQAAHRVWSAGMRLVVPGGKYNKALAGTRLRPDFQIGKVSIELKKFSKYGREAMKKARAKYGKHGSFTIPWYY